MEKAYFYMQLALKEAETALLEKEVPIGCVFVHNHTVIAKERNATNKTLNVH